MATPSRPSSAILTRISAGHRLVLSSSAALGAISRAAKSRAVSRIIRCSSVSSKSMATRPSLARLRDLHEPRHGARALAQAWLGPHGDGHGGAREQVHVEGVVAERRVDGRLGADARAKPGHLPGAVGDGALD